MRNGLNQRVKAAPWLEAVILNPKSSRILPTGAVHPKGGAVVLARAASRRRDAQVVIAVADVRLALHG